MDQNPEEEARIRAAIEKRQELVDALKLLGIEEDKARPRAVWCRSLLSVADTYNREIVVADTENTCGPG